MFISFTVLVQLLLASSLYGLILDSMEDTRIERDARVTIDEMQTLINRFFDAERLSALYVAHPDDETALRLKSEVASFRRELKSLGPKLGADPGSVKTLAKASSIARELEGLVVSFVDRVKLDEQIEVEKFVAFNMGREKVRRLFGCMKELINSKKLLLRETSDSSLKRKKSMLQILVLGELVNLVISGGLLFFFVKAVVSKLRILTTNSKLFADGKKLIPAMAGKDEIAFLDRSFHQMAFTVEGLIQRLQDSEQHVRLIIDSAPVGIVLLTPEGQLISCNDRFLEMLGHTEQELHNGSLSQFIEALADTKLEEISTGRPFETKLRRIDDGVVDVTCSLIRIEQGERDFFILSTTDISDRLELERSKARFMDIVSHDIRAPLASTQVFLTALATGGYDGVPVKVQERAERTARNIDSMIRLVSNILDFSRNEAGALKVEIRACDADSIVKRAVESLAEFAQHEGVSINVVRSDAEVYADFDRVQQVLINLLSNAIKFSSRDSVVKIGSVGRGNQVEFFVEDHGPGIPEASRELIFDSYRQVNLSDANRGFGLGLSIARQIVRLHESDLIVDSEEGQGSRFSFSLEEA